MMELIEMLQNAAREEHAAIIQYLRHAYMMGEGEEACEIEAIARDEMRHFWMLSRWIVKLGGTPTIERGFVDTEGKTLPEWMDRDEQAEERAIAMYRDYISRIEDPALKADIERILADEEHHRGIFAHLADKFRRLETQATPETPEEPSTQPETPSLSPTDIEALDWAIRHEYAAILQYIFHSFLVDDEEVSRQLELQAINEMQHMGWLSEEMAGKGGEIPLEPHPVDLSQKLPSMLRADIELEQDTAAKYGEFLQRMSDEGLKELFAFIQNHELYHERLFKRLLERVSSLSPSGWTIGSLKGR